MLQIWANPQNQSFRDYVRPKLLKLDCEYAVSDYLTKTGPGDVVLSFGKAKLKAMQDMSIVPKNRAVGSLRGTVFEHEDRKFLVTWDPVLLFQDYKYRPEVIWDLKLAKRLVQTGTTIPQVGNYIEVDDFEEVNQHIWELCAVNGRCDVSIDLETVGTDYMDTSAWIVAIGITINAGQSYVKYLKDEDVPWQVIEQLKWILSAKDRKIFVYGANFKYDMLWLQQKCGIENFSNFKLDTTLVGSILQENRSNSLNLHAKIYTPMGGYDDGFNALYDKGAMHLVPKADVVQYAGGDTDAVFQVAQKFKHQLHSDKRLLRFYTRLLHPAQNAVRKMEHRGMCVDLDRYKELDEELVSTLDIHQAEMMELLPRKLQAKHCNDLSPTRPVIIRDFLFSKQGLGLKPKILTGKTKQPSTSGEHFAMFKDHPVAGPYIDAYMGFIHAKKTKSTYVDGFLSHLRSDGRFHPSYMLFRGLYHADKTTADDSGGRTGRTSCREPAYQTIPKHTMWAMALRSVYVPPPGMVILDVDFSQGELRIVACLADEPTMLDNYHNNQDLHLRTGAKLNGYTLGEAQLMQAQGHPEIKMIRQGGKAGNFGLIYGMGAAGFVHYARNSYGVHLTLAQADAFIEEFFDDFFKLRPWHEEMINLVHKTGTIVSPLGRIRHFPLIDTFFDDIRAQQERQAINTGVQSTLTDMGLLAMAELDKAYPDLWLFGFTHDSLSFYVPEEDYKMWAGRIRDVMEHLPLKQFGWEPKLSFPVEVEYGLNNLAETVKLPLAA